MDDAGNFVVAWQGWGSDAYGWGINAQRFAQTERRLGGRFVANSYQAGYQSSAAVAMSPSGEFVIAWQDEMNGGAMFAQRYDASGTPSRRSISGQLSPGEHHVIRSRRDGWGRQLRGNVARTRPR